MRPTPSAVFALSDLEAVPEATTMDLLKKFGRMNAADIIREASEA